MIATEIELLKMKKYEYQNKVNYKNKQISKCEQAHESLVAFKNIVTRSQSEFHSVNSRKAGILSEVDLIKKNSKIARTYTSGMRRIFSGIGSKVIGVVYSALIGAISIKLRQYINSINDYEDDIERYNNKIEELDRKIEEKESIPVVAMRGG